MLAHVPKDVGIEHTIESGVEIQHNYNLQAFVAKDYERQYGANALDIFDFSEADAKLPELVALMLENRVAFTPTMVVDVAGFTLMESLPDISQSPMLQRPEYRYVPHDWIVSWVDPNGGELAIVLRDSGTSSIEEIVPPPENRAETLAYQQRQLKALVDAGVPVLAGSDCSALAVVWGFSLHDELDLFVESGLTPYQALSATTRVPSEVMGDPDEWGTIEVGKRADMVLLNTNPLENISHTRDIAGVMVRGRWLPQTELQGMLDELASKYVAETETMNNIELQSYTNEEAGFSTVVPTGWNELLPGTYARSNPAVDPTILGQMAFPMAVRDVAIAEILTQLGVNELPPDPIRTMDSETLSWSMYLISGDNTVLVALADSDATTYMVILQAKVDEFDGLAEQLLIPAMMAFTPAIS